MAKKEPEKFKKHTVKEENKFQMQKSSAHKMEPAPLCFGKNYDCLMEHSGHHKAYYY